MLGPSRDVSELEGEIRAARKLTLDGSKAIYDLRFSVDFSNPYRTADAIARVVWHEDAQSWWTLQGGKPVFSATRTVEILVPEEHHRRIAKAVDLFKKDLRQQELGDHLADYLDSVEDHQADWGAIFLMGPFWAWLAQSSDNRARRREELQDLFDKMAGSIHVSPSP